ncbi:carnitine dehydratase [Sphingobium sp. SCG-1]|uniref:CoA transferase n=1 Tax=Sphingobium sp. SCG-1 TaxID=2072936 RepID=UPI000CD6ABAC|nr:CoA transferase [Sphingobium sp. SCG-1]AUW58165.1 carnitine dehydratase [Sphingobium sp. SCG-1]
MYDLLRNLTVVEGASFVAAPSATLHLQQMGADVIRFDPIGGGPDFTRWPRAENGASYYWEGLNKGKKSVAINLGSPRGRELAQDLAATVGRLVTNYPVNSFLSHERLQAKRPDMITVRVMGWSDGGNALDYTVNAAVGVPGMTGPADSDRPVNHVLPAWDLATGLYAAFALLAAERARDAGSGGCEVKVPLGDIALSSLAALGQVGESYITGRDRPRYGNDLYGAFGRDFTAADGARVMVTAISQKQWNGLLAALAITDKVMALESALGLSFAKDEGLRFDHREALNAIVGAAIAERPLAALAEAFEDNGVTWAPYRSLSEGLRQDPRIGENPISSMVDHLTGTRYPTPGAAGTIPQRPRVEPTRAPHLGEHSEQILADVMGLSTAQIGLLVQDGIVSLG